MTLQQIRQALLGSDRDVDDPRLFQRITVGALGAWIAMGGDLLGSCVYGPDVLARSGGGSRSVLFVAGGAAPAKPGPPPLALPPAVGHFSPRGGGDDGGEKLGGEGGGPGLYGGKAGGGRGGAPRLGRRAGLRRGLQHRRLGRHLRSRRRRRAPAGLSGGQAASRSRADSAADLDQPPRREGVRGPP